MINIAKSKKGITLIALVITIIILLILAGVSISALSGDSGLIRRAGNAKEQTEIAEEKEIIKTAVIQATGRNKKGELVLSEFQAQLDRYNAKVYEDGDDFIVIFKSNRMYTVDKEGNIKDEVSMYEAASKKLDSQLTDQAYGSEEKPYEINCIEDLVDISYKVNGITVNNDGTLAYTNTRNDFKDKHFILTKNLNFNLSLSYENSSRKDYGDINENGTVEELLTELTTGKGWIPIGGAREAINNCNFNGMFKGNGNIISSFYINNASETKSSSLFGQVSNNSIIENLGLKGNIYCNSNSAAGFESGHVNGKKNLINCYYEGRIENINSSGITGGLVARPSYGGEINKCYAKGTIIGKGTVGGIIGDAGTIKIDGCHNESDVFNEKSSAGGIAGKGGEIINCYNIGNISGNGAAYEGVGGIVGYGGNDIENCYNTGTIEGKNHVGGIKGFINNSEIKKCFNKGKVIGSGNRVGGIVGYNHTNSGTVINQCYNLGEVSGVNTVGGIAGQIGETGKANTVYNCYNLGKVKGNQVAGIVYGYNDKVKCISCYNLGELEGATKFGVTYKGNVKNCYYLENHGISTESAIVKSESELKNLASTLDKTFTIDDANNTITINENASQNVWKEDKDNKNEGYPIFEWQ